MIYFVLNAAANSVKIGFTDGPVSLRLAGLDVGSADELCLLGAIVGTRETEAQWHHRYADLRTKGEWFQCRVDLAEAIAAVTRESTSEVMRPAELLAYVELVGLLREHGRNAFSIRGPLGKGVDELIKDIAANVHAESGPQGMQMVADSVEAFAMREYGDSAACGVIHALDHRFDGIGGWYA